MAWNMLIASSIANMLGNVLSDKQILWIDKHQISDSDTTMYEFTIEQDTGRYLSTTKSIITPHNKREKERFVHIIE